MGNASFGRLLVRPRALNRGVWVAPVARFRRAHARRAYRERLIRAAGGCGFVGTAVPGAFLYIIASINLVILVGILRVFRLMRRPGDEAAQEEQLDRRAFLNRGQVLRRP
jgi:high-affinity nickel permease